MKQLKIGHRKGIYDINPKNKVGVFTYSYKKNEAFFCIAKVYEQKKTGVIQLETRKLSVPERKSGNTTNYIRLNAELIPKLIKLLQEFAPESVEEASKSGKEEREIEDLIDKVGI